jgi:hypothetical protein
VVALGEVDPLTTQELDERVIRAVLGDDGPAQAVRHVATASTITASARRVDDEIVASVVAIC